ncbi:MAG: heme NO-binding domain-containing protein, partial [Sphingomonadaceae bacterium]
DILCENFGEWLFGRFAILYPELISRYETSDHLLSEVGPHIHEQVVALNPDASPPEVAMTLEDGAAVVEYRSHRPFAHSACGLVRGCLAHFGDDRKVIWLSGGDPTYARFHIIPKDRA